MRLRIIAAPLLMVAGLSACQAIKVADDTGHAKPLYSAVKPQVKDFEVTGEVVDAWCFSSKIMGPGRGERHKSCGVACAMGGVTLGIVDDSGQLFIAAKHKGYTGCKELLVPYMAKRVHATGWLAESGGCKLLKIAKVELAGGTETENTKTKTNTNNDQQTKTNKDKQTKTDQDTPE